MEGYYDGTEFHRIVKGFIAQGGDPTGTGLGGDSVFGEPFADEFHSRLRFSHRGLLAMANTGRHSNKSQFFFTLDKTEDLNKKNTIFGKIVGDTIYNLLEIGDAEVGDDERPTYPIKINAVEILSNPFDDIEPRTTAQERAALIAEERMRAEREANKKSKGKKNLSLLSFGDEAASEEAVIKSVKTKKKIQSSHDLLDDERLSKVVSASKDELIASAGKSMPDDRKSSTAPTPAVPAKRVYEDESEEESSDDDADDRAQREKLLDSVKQKLSGGGGSSKVSSVRAEIEKVQAELRQMDASRRSNSESAKKSDKPMNPLEAMRNKYKGKATMGKRPKGGDGSDILGTLEAFKEKLLHPGDSKSKQDAEETTCKLHGLANCKSCKRDEDGAMDDEDDSGWFNNDLRFQKEPANVYAPVVDDYSFFDPRDPKSADKFSKPDAGSRGTDVRRDAGSRGNDVKRDGGRDAGRDSGRGGNRDYDRRDRDRGGDRDGGRDRNHLSVFLEIKMDITVVVDTADEDATSTHSNAQAIAVNADGTAQMAEAAEGDATNPDDAPVDPDAEESGKDAIDAHEAFYQEQKEKRKKALQQQLLDKSKVRSSYYTCSKKETTVLQYVENFNRQYAQLYPGRKDLFLCPLNEFDIRKFVCTSIRPTQPAYKELYDYRSCAKFLADYLTYEPLEPPHELPPKLPSPTYTLKIQCGNCFDYSVLLVSLLRGFGYDAYVVSGYATRDITILDETKTDSDTIGIPSPTGYDPESKPETSVNASSVKKSDAEAKYKMKPPRMLKSHFMINQEEKSKIQALKELENRRILMEKEKAKMIEDDDELKGLRIHAWVMVLPGKREIAEAFFIEPSTGRIYSTDNENYLGVESVFSSTNYWVNMQVCYDGLKGIHFDLGDNSKWEFVLLDNTQPGPSHNKNGDKNEDNVSDDEEENEDENLEILDLPPSWVDRISITKEQFESKCPAGSKTMLYRNARVETFAEYHRQDGMVSRYTFFADEGRDFYGEIREMFSNRKDKLRDRIRVPYTGRVHEYFDPGRQHGLKEHIMIEEKTTEIHFFPTSRSDGLVKRVEAENKVIEYFTDREDKLVYRSVTYEYSDNAPDDSKDGKIITKMTEKFERNKDVPAHEDPAKKTYLLKDEKIKVVYHLEEGRIIPSYREFKKPNADQKASSLETPISFEVNPFIKPAKKQHLYAQLCNLMRSEQACIQAIKNSDREVSEILQARAFEEKDISLVISVYDTIRNNT
ncbi:hypothetical protein HDU98_011207, partial [Podochytrium sp. JEL0797]